MNTERDVTIYRTYYAILVVFKCVALVYIVNPKHMLILKYILHISIAKWCFRYTF